MKKEAQCFPNTGYEAKLVYEQVSTASVSDHVLTDPSLVTAIYIEHK